MKVTAVAPKAVSTSLSLASDWEVPGGESALDRSLLSALQIYPLRALSRSEPRAAMADLLGSGTCLLDRGVGVRDAEPIRAEARRPADRRLLSMRGLSIVGLIGEGPIERWRDKDHASKADEHQAPMLTPDPAQLPKQTVPHTR
jgi:hypothetical protein